MRRRLLEIGLSLGLGAAALAVLLLPRLSAADDAGAVDDAGALEDSGKAEAAKKKVYFIDIPEEDRKSGKTKPPTVADWRKAEEIELARGGRGCHAYRVREWLKLTCKTDVSVRAEVIAGNSSDIYFFMTEPECSVLDLSSMGMESQQICTDLVDIVFPVHVGDRRAIQIAALRGGYGAGPPFWGTHLISLTWLEDEPGPVLTVNHVSTLGF